MVSYSQEAMQPSPTNEFWKELDNFLMRNSSVSLLRLCLLKYAATYC